MNPQEAIQVNQQIQSFIAQEPTSKEYQAIALGIEALKWIKEERKLQGILYPGLLPGETEF